MCISCVPWIQVKRGVTKVGVVIGVSFVPSVLCYVLFVSNRTIERESNNVFLLSFHFGSTTIPKLPFNTKE